MYIHKSSDDLSTLRHSKYPFNNNSPLTASLPSDLFLEVYQINLFYHHPMCHQSYPLRVILNSFDIASLYLKNKQHIWRTYRGCHLTVSVS
jgi:hypothetical protein